MYTGVTVRLTGMVTSEQRFEEMWEQVTWLFGEEAFQESEGTVQCVKWSMLGMSEELPCSQQAGVE